MYYASVTPFAATMHRSYTVRQMSQVTWAYNLMHDLAVVYTNINFTHEFRNVAVTLICQ